MSLFLLPADITKDFERQISKYWWGLKDNGKPGIHWMNWDKVSRHKMNGGLGFRDFNSFNLALLGKQGWRFMTEPNRLSSKLYKARYFADCHFLQSKLGTNPSFIWRSIWEAKHVVSAGARWKVGNGKEITILHQPWLQDGTNPYITSYLQGLANATVHSLRTEDGQQWDTEILQDLFNQRDQECIYNTPYGGEGEVDMLYWNEDMTGMYTVRSAYRMIRSQKEMSFSADSSEIWTLI